MLLTNTSKVARLVSVMQVLLIWSYLFLNVRDFGNGVELRLLAIFFVFGLAVMIVKDYPRLPGIKLSFFAFVVIVFWIAFRYLIDRDDYSGLIGVMIGTTGGVFLFYFMGLVSRECLKSGVAQFWFGSAALHICYLSFSALLAIDFLSQVRHDIFYIDNASEDYQRPGNFMSISFLIISYVYVLAGSASHIKDGKSVGRLILWAIYTASVIALLLSAQAIGSNSATAVILGIYVISISFVFEMGGGALRALFFRVKISRSGLVKMLRVVLMRSAFLALAILAGAILFCLVLDIDVMGTRLFGFGEGGNSSIDSRMGILWRWGVEQVSYAPVFGNIDVAYHVTGDEGVTLHNFLPDVWASLGLVGLVMIVSLYFLIGYQLHRSVTTRCRDITLPGVLNRAASLYSILVVAFLFLFANVSAGFSWAVLWFSLGFFQTSLSSPRRRDKDSRFIG